jgi:hypothetical protein
MQREELHHRQIDLRFYRRSDDLYEVVGRLVDTKSHAFRRQLAQADTPPHTPVHDIAVHLVIDDGMLVHEAFAAMHATPFEVCPQATQALALLRGLSLRKGWNRQVRELLGGAVSCTHIVELLGPMATTAFQGLAPLRLQEINRPGSEALRRAKVDSCYAYGAEREVVARLWPHLHRGATDATAQKTFKP